MTNTTTSATTHETALDALRILITRRFDTADQAQAFAAAQGFTVRDTLFGATVASDAYGPAARLTQLPTTAMEWLWRTARPACLDGRCIHQP